MLEDYEEVKSFFGRERDSGVSAVVVSLGSKGRAAACAAARSAGVGSVACVDASEEEGGDAALELGATDLPWIALGSGGSAVSGGAPSTIHAAVAALNAVDEDAIRSGVRDAYAATAAGGPSVLPGDCGDVGKRREMLGYTADFELEAGADLGLGCGNPLLAANLAPGEVVVDLGAGRRGKRASVSHLSRGS